jgi:hypothetical protein
MSPGVLIHCYGSTDVHIQGAHHSALGNLHTAVQRLQSKQIESSNCAEPVSAKAKPPGTFLCGLSTASASGCACFRSPSSLAVGACYQPHATIYETIVQAGDNSALLCSSLHLKCGAVSRCVPSPAPAQSLAGRGRRAVAWTQQSAPGQPACISFKIWRHAHESAALCGCRGTRLVATSVQEVDALWYSGLFRQSVFAAKIPMWPQIPCKPQRT